MMTVSSGQTQTISQGQSDTGDTILSGGTEVVASGGTSRRPVLEGGFLSDEGSVTRAQVGSGGALVDSGTAFQTTVSSGGVMYVDAAGGARASMIDSGGAVYDGGTMNRTTVNSGGIFYVGGPVTVSGTTSDYVGSANRTVIRGGTEYVLSGNDDRTTIGRSGFEYVDSGGTASRTTIQQGGELVVSSGGVADSTVIGRGGQELVMAGGIASGVTINRGGTLEFDASYTGITQDIGFSDAGFGVATLKFDATATTSGGLIYDGIISGFDSPKDEIDLVGLGFTSGQTSATSVLSGSNTVVTVTNGSQTVALTLAGDHTSDSFTVSSDGSGPGTTIADQPPWPDSPLGWLEQFVESAISGLNGLKSASGFQQLVDQIENWDHRAGSGSEPTGSPYEPRSSIPNFSISGFDAGWHSHMVQALASFGDRKGGAPQETPIQTNDQTSQSILAGAATYHN
jgi:autotransporter passenger strand-loop-strand repeat protein